MQQYTHYNNLFQYYQYGYVNIFILFFVILQDVTINTMQKATHSNVAKIFLVLLNLRIYVTPG